MSEIKPQDGNEKPGLLHHQHPPVIDHDGQPPNGGPADGVVLDEIDAYHPDTHHADEAPTLAEIEEAAGESHHGLIRERGPKVGREEEAALEDAHEDQAAVLVVARDLGPELADARRDFLGGEER